MAWYPTGLLALFAYRGHNLGPNRAILPREIRERIRVLPVGYEFYLSDSRTLLRTGMYACKVYDNTILTVEKVPLQATLADEPIIRAAFDIYLDDGLLVYVADPCVAGEGMMFVHLYPVEVEALPPHRGNMGSTTWTFSGTGSRGEGGGVYEWCGCRSTRSRGWRPGSTMSVVHSGGKRSCFRRGLQAVEAQRWRESERPWKGLLRAGNPAERRPPLPSLSPHGP